MLRRFDEPIKPGVHYRPRPGAYGIIADKENLLITFQSRPDPEFQLPGGGIETGETPTVALLREIREETGWAVRVERRLGAYLRYTYMPDYGFWARKVCNIFLCRPVRDLRIELEQYHSAHWVSRAEAAQILKNAGDRHFVKGLNQPSPNLPCRF